MESLNTSYMYALAWNDDFARKLIPNTVIQTLVLVIGLVGNSLVLVIYSLKMRRNMEARYFIPILTVFDILTTLVSCVYFIMDNMYFLHFPSGPLCRTFVFLTGFTMMTSVAFLLAIAVQRFLKICRPLGRQMDRRWKRISIGLIISLNLIYNIPTLWVSGLGEITGTYRGVNVTALSCFTGTGFYPTFEKALYGLLSFLVVGNIIVTTALYVPIAVIVCKQVSNKNSRYKASMRSTTSMDTSTTSSSTKKGATKNIEMSQKNQSGNEETTSKSEGNCSVEKIETQITHTISTISNSNFQTPTAILHQKDTKGKVIINRSKNVNFNAMFLMIVIIYVVSYIPTCIMLLVTKSVDNFWLTLSEGELVLYNWLSKTYIINHIANPFIFGYFDLKFRDNLAKVFCKWRERKI